MLRIRPCSYLHREPLTYIGSILQMHIWVKAQKLKASEGKKEDCLHFEVEIDRALTTSMLLKVVMSKMASDVYDVDYAHYDVRFPDTNSEDDSEDEKEDAFKADMTMPPLMPDEPIFQIKSKMLMVVVKTETSLRIQSQKGGGRDEEERGRLPTLSQLSPEELEEYSKRDTLKFPTTCMVRLVVSPLCMKALVGHVGKETKTLAHYVPSNILIQSEATFAVKDVIRLFLESLCRGYRRQWKQWMIRKTKKIAFYKPIDDK